MWSHRAFTAPKRRSKDCDPRRPATLDRSPFLGVSRPPTNSALSGACGAGAYGPREPTAPARGASHAVGDIIGHSKRVPDSRG